MLDQLTRDIQKLDLDGKHEEVPESSSEKLRDSEDRAWRERRVFEEQRRKTREEREREQALIGEKHWIRQGGILRDANGRRDTRRTEEVRKIVEREDREQLIVERWQAYENRWAIILSSNDKLIAFGDIPWPLILPPKDPEDLRNPSKIAEFLFESLTLEGNKTSRKERLRTSLLRWHPDKLRGVLERVLEEEITIVKDGIDAVVISLMKLQEAEKGR